MATELYANNFATTLNGSVTIGAGSIVVNAAAPVALQTAGGQFRIIVDAEIMIVTAGASGTTWTVSRGAETTAPAAHSNGAPVTHVLTSGSLALVGGIQGVQIIKNAPHQPYAALGDGVTDDSAVITQAITDVKNAGGGALWLPNATYACASLLGNFVNTDGVTIRGLGGGAQDGTGPRLLYTGAGSGDFLRFQSSYALTIEGVNFMCASNSFTGRLLRLDGGAGQGDCFNPTISHCGFGGASGAVTSAAAGLSLNATLKAELDHLDFSFLQRAIIFGDNGSGGAFCVNCASRTISCASIVLNPILLGSDCEVCSWDNMDFEPLTSGKTGGFEGDGVNPIYCCEFKNIWAGDVGVAGGMVFTKMYTDARVCKVSNVFLHLNGADTAFDCRGTWDFNTINVENAGSLFASPTGQFTLALRNVFGAGLGGPVFAGTLPSPLYVENVGGFFDTRPSVPRAPVTTASGTSPNPIQSNSTNQPGGVTIYTNSAAKTATLHPQSDGSQFIYQLGETLWLVNGNTGNLTVAASAGATLNAPGGAVIAPGSMGFLVQQALDTWYLTVT